MVPEEELSLCQTFDTVAQKSEYCLYVNVYNLIQYILAPSNFYP